MDSLCENKAPQHPSAIILQETWSSETQTTLTSIEARICPTAPSLCLRIQAFVAVRRPNVSFLRPGGSPVSLCAHINNRETGISDRISSHILAYDSGSSMGAEYGKCSKCNTEWCLELRDLGARDAGLILTQWIDLGPGLSPHDPGWRSQPMLEKYEMGAESIIASPRRRFATGLMADGSKHTLSDEELCRRHPSLLKGRRYTAVMKKDPSARFWSMNSDSHQPRSSGCVVL
ncbi:uncharacterized protein N7459_009030 [Penicillium hispanicum]|uniref:uncharacterized protein n=1 Tax=Penicillium hispanicum TaxID=1080232 RepID=UPI0025409ECC|nr:uncharacterized protein N7459_009030 [Penicillium hispanicum]KAJ5569600.1 hypothetical protein N7459_009030 [Penicillium hispanicum]